VAIARIIQTNIASDVYDQMRNRLGITDTPPAGCAFHVATTDDGGNVRIVEVWDSREQAEAWAEKVSAAREEAGIGGPPPSIEYLGVHSIVQR
jgi:heme-degrading monooxygenase HmoA